VIELVSEGLTNREIAARGVPVGAHRGVHLRQVFRKLDVGSRVELTRHYLEQTAAPRCRDGRRRESLRVDYANA